MKVPVKSVADIGQAIRVTRICQDLDQLTAAQLSNAGQSFMSHLENGKETAQIGKVLQVLESLGIGIELTLPPDIDSFLAKNNDFVRIPDVDLHHLDFNMHTLNQRYLNSEFKESSRNEGKVKYLELLEQLLNSKRVRRS